MKQFVISEQARANIFQVLTQSKGLGLSFNELQGLLNPLIDAKECKCQDCKLDDKTPATPPSPTNDPVAPKK